MDVWKAPRRISDSTMRLAAPPARVFPLLCPVREYDWIDGWKCDMVYAASGVAELGGIFITRSEAGEEVWTISRYEPNEAIEFVRVAANVWVVKLDLTVEADGPDRTLVRARRTYTALTSVGATAMDKIVPEQDEFWLKGFETMANHYLTTGQMFHHPQAATDR